MAATAQTGIEADDASTSRSNMNTGDMEIEAGDTSES